jgi:hypothetical protein
VKPAILKECQTAKEDRTRTTMRTGVREEVDEIGNLITLGLLSSELFSHFSLRRG